MVINTRFPNNDDLVVPNQDPHVMECTIESVNPMGTIEDYGLLDQSPNPSPRDDRNALSKLPLNPIQEHIRGEEDEENPPEPLRIKPPEAISDSPYCNLDSSPKAWNPGKRVIALNESALKQVRLHDHQQQLIGGKDRRKHNRSQPVALEEQNTTRTLHESDKSGKEGMLHLQQLHEDLCKTLFTLFQNPLQISNYAIGR